MGDPVLPHFKHQQREWDLHRDSPARALVWQMRTGKTKACVDLACHLWERCEIDAVVVVAPNNVHLNWQRRELPKHHWPSVRRRDFAWQASLADRASYALEHRAMCEGGRELRWYMLNAEALGNARGKEALGAFVKSCWRFLLVVDEVHEFRGHGSKRAHALRLLARRSAYRRILSANPLDNSPLHAYSEYEVLAQSALGFDEYGAFEARYAVKEEIWVPGGFGNGGVKRSPRRRMAVVGHKNQPELRERIARWTSVVLRDEVDELPDLVRGREEFELTREQKQLHNDLVRAALVRLDSGQLIPPAEGGALRIKLQQIASGYYVMTETGEVHDVVPDVDNPRLRALCDLAAQVPGKFIVWCMFREDVRRVHARLEAQGYGPVHYYGGTTPRERAAHEEAFARNPRVRALVGQFQAGGQGLDFSAAKDIVWYSHTGDLLRRRQADERATQMGGRRIAVTDLVAVGSSDEQMLADLEAKSVGADYLAGSGLRDYLRLIR